MVEQKLIFPSTYTSIPTNQVEPLFKEAIESLLKPTIEIEGGLDPHVAEFLFQHCLDCRNTIIHWVIKLKWSSRHKIPGSQAHVRCVKPWGEMFFRLMELCIQCQGLMGHKATGYPDAAEWFYEIWRESVVFEAVDTVAMILGIEDTKENWLVGLRQTIQALRDDQNPYSLKTQPHLHRLVKCAIKLAEPSDEFRKRYWKPYIYSLSSCATQLDYNSKGYYRKLLVRLEQRKGKTFWHIYESSGRGKGLKLIYAKEVIPKTLGVYGL